MSDSQPPPKKSSAGLIILGLLLLIGAGAAIAWKLSSGGSEEVIEEKISLPAPAETAPPVLDEAPPPPPSEEELAEADKKPAANGNGSTTTKAASGPAGCSSTCNGSAGAELQSALRARAGQARGCYNRALRQNSTLEGKLSVAIKLNPQGTVCGASATADTLGDPSVTSCVVQMFRSGKYPAPTGGSIDTVVPLNFVAGQ